MYRLSLIISEIYNKYLPLAEKDGIILNLDFSDTTKEIADPERVKKFLDEHLGDTLKRSDKGEVTISVSKTAITITDSATTLSHAACTLLSNRYIDVTSHVGFGTTVKIFFQPREFTSTEKTLPPAQVTVEGISADVALNNNAKQPTLATETKVALAKGKKKIGLGAKLKLTGKSKAKKSATAPKPTPKKLTTKSKSARTNRQLAAAAKKADKEVKRIAKTAKKSSKIHQTSQNHCQENYQARPQSQKTYIILNYSPLFAASAHFLLLFTHKFRYLNSFYNFQKFP